MLHALVAGLSCAFIFFVLCASAYVVSFAFLGIDKRPAPINRAPLTRFLVLVPAHNQAPTIEATLRSLQQANYPESLVRIAVVVDNCNDDTADIARSCGVETWIRTFPSNPAKGGALYWAFDKAAIPYDLAAIVEAGTEIDPGFFSAMDATYADSLQQGQIEIVLQARHLHTETVSAPSWFDPFVIASKAAENSFSFRPRTALGLANLVQGTGLCISRAAIEHLPYRASTVIEDAEYAVALALRAIPVVYVDEARVTSRVTERLRDTASERLAWAGDIFPLLRHSVPDLLRAGFRQHRWKLAEMALMLIFTSRLLLVYATLISIVLLDLAYRFRDFDILALALAASLIMQGVYLYLVLRKSDAVRVPARRILFMPLYVGFLGAIQLGAFLGFRKRQIPRAIW